GTTASSGGSCALGPGVAAAGRTSSLDQLGRIAVEAGSGVPVSSRLIGNVATRSMNVCACAAALVPAVLALVPPQAASPAALSAASAATRIAAPVTAPVYLRGPRRRPWRAPARGALRARRSPSQPVIVGGRRGVGCVSADLCARDLLRRDLDQPD